MLDQIDTVLSLKPLQGNSEPSAVAPAAAGSSALHIRPENYLNGQNLESLEICPTRYLSHCPTSGFDDLIFSEQLRQESTPRPGPAPQRNIPRQNAATPNPAGLSALHIRGENYLCGPDLEKLVISPQYLRNTAGSLPQLHDLQTAPPPAPPLQHNIPQYSVSAPGISGPTAPQAVQPVVRDRIDPSLLLFSPVPHENFTSPHVAGPPRGALQSCALNRGTSPAVPPEAIRLPSQMTPLEQFNARSDAAVPQSLESKPSTEDMSPETAEDANATDGAMPDVEDTAQQIVEGVRGEDMSQEEPSQFWPFTREQVVAIHFCKYAVSKVGWLVSDRHVSRAMQQKLKNEIRRLWAHWVMRRITRNAFTAGVARFAEEFCMPMRKLCLLSSFAPYYKLNVNVELDRTMEFNW